MIDLINLVEDIVKYTKTWCISETEWYWNMDAVRKSGLSKNNEITWEEFEIAIREEILYDLVFRFGIGLHTSIIIANENESSELFEKETNELQDKVCKLISKYERVEVYR